MAKNGDIIAIQNAQPGYFYSLLDWSKVVRVEKWGKRGVEITIYGMYGRDAQFIPQNVTFGTLDNLTLAVRLGTRIPKNAPLAKNAQRVANLELATLAMVAAINGESDDLTTRHKQRESGPKPPLERAHRRS